MTDTEQITFSPDQQAHETEAQYKSSGSVCNSWTAEVSTQKHCIIIIIITIIIIVIIIIIIIIVHHLFINGLKLVMFFSNGGSSLTDQSEQISCQHF